MPVIKNNGTKYLLAYLFFLCVTTTRFFFEANFAKFVDKSNLIFHHHYWFLFVFLIFLINFKYFLKLHPSKTWWMAFCSPVILTPLIYNMIFRGGNSVQFNYLSAIDLPNYFKDIATFMIFSEKNRPIAIELMIITFSIFIFSFFITKKPVRSILCALSCYLSLMILAGTVIIAPHKPDFTLFVLNSSLKLQNFMSFVYFSASSIAAVMLFWDEITVFLSKKERMFLFCVSFIILFTVFQILLQSPTFFDRFIMIFHSGLAAFFVVTIVFATKNSALNILLFLQIIISGGILFHAFSGS